MSKELEALNKIQHDFGQLKGQELVNCYELISKGLQRLESIDNSNPSEALKQLGDISYFIMEAYSDHEFLKDNQKESKQCFMNYCSNIKRALIKAQKQEKVLSIINKKNVDIIRIKHLIFKSQKNPKYWDLRYYNEARVIDDEKLTQEEFELLKEMLK